jgi:hypothetical protein
LDKEERMEKYTIFDTIVIGAICLICFLAVLFILVPSLFNVDQSICDLHKESTGFRLLKYSLCTGDLTAKLLVYGVGSHVLGAIIQIISILIFSRFHQDNTARDCLKQRVHYWASTIQADPEKKVDLVCHAVRDRIAQAKPDSIFAWIHYSDPRKDLIEWGRRKAHYVYLAENWLLSIVMGSSAGLVVWLLYHNSGSWISNHAVIGILFFGIVATFGATLWCILRKDNKRFNDDMIMMYIAGRMWQELEEEFLPKSPEKQS